MNQLAFTTNIRLHLLIGLLQGMWLYLFLVIIGPFDVYELSFWWRAQLMLGYWMLFTVAYWLVIPVQNRFYHHLQKWTWPAELSVVALVFILAFPPIYSYYKSAIVEGEFPLPIFTSEVYLPASLILFPMMIAVRRFMMRQEKTVDQEPSYTDKIILKGTYQKDILQIHWADLVCVKSAGNYVEIYYLVADRLQKKLLRTSTQKIEAELPNLIRTHRSCLINPNHFLAWKDRKQLIITQLEVPVSENYRTTIEEQFSVRP